MNERLLMHIDDYLYHTSGEPLQQMIYIIAKLCLISAPAGWAVKRPRSAKDRLFATRDEAVIFLNQAGRKEDYITPLYATVKVDMSAGELKHLLLTPFPSEDK
ncbi:hypothetical protein [Pantoea anthophila]|uniref:hypothetical protein n=1 Tax=Pantoea anthophila TaxID=470931 RepID=UPI00301D912B